MIGICSSYLLSKEAEQDIAEIAEYTIAAFGIEQARQYRDGLIKTFVTLADSPLIGRDCGYIKSTYRRHVHISHVIYYRVQDDSVEIMRVLHGRQDPLRHL